MVQLEIRKNAYYDSVTLMRISKELKKLEGVQEALVGMGTDLNREIAGHIGVTSPRLETEVTANDFFVAADCESEAVFAAVKQTVDALLNEKAEAGDSAYRPPTLDGALKIDPALNMALVSVPGKFAANVAMECLEHGINVLLFSDNVTIEEERALKEYAYAHELLLMGPDCGTAIINGVPLAFANVVRRGDIGVVAASGTGAQEVSSLIDRFGGGVSQLIGTGGRDLKIEIGGPMMKLGLDALKNDPQTRVIVLVSKPPAPAIAREMLALATEAGKPVVVCFIGGDRAEVERFGLTAAVSLEDAAQKAVALSRGETPEDFTGFSMGEAEAAALARKIAAGFAPGQRFVRGFYTGGTLCDESMKLMIPTLGHIYSNIPLHKEDLLADAKGGESREHTCLDFGDDAFTVGRPHPMIDPSLRAERVLTEADDPTCAVILCDCVIGYGSHPNPAEDLAEAIRGARQTAANAGRQLACICAVCGTEGDPQGLSRTQRQLEEAGALVLPSNAQAARFALLILDALRKEGTNA